MFSNLFLMGIGGVLMIITRLNPMYGKIDDPFARYVGGYEGLNVAFLVEMFNRFKEVLTMYYWNGYTYQIVSHDVQFIFKKVILILIVFAFLIPFFKKTKIMKFDQLVVIVLLFSLIQVYLAEKFGVFPFGGRYIMPFAIFLLYLVSNPLTWLSRNKYTKFPLFLSVIVVASLFLFHEWCYYALVDISFDFNINGPQSYAVCKSILPF